MPSPHIRSTVIQALQTQLELIVGTPNYFNTISTPYLYNKNLTTINDLPAIVIVEGSESTDLDVTEKFNHTLNVAIIGLIKEGDNSEKSDNISEMLHDIQKAIGTDYTLGGEALDINILGNDYIQNEKSDRVGVIVNIEVIYRTSITDPASPN